MILASENDILQTINNETLIKEFFQTKARKKTCKLLIINKVIHYSLFITMYLYIFIIIGRYIIIYTFFFVLGPHLKLWPLGLKMS